MARKLREWQPNTSYHVTARGNRKNNIFKNKQDFCEYLKLLAETLNHFKVETPYELLSYCLMDNHVHLLIYTSSMPLGPFIKKLHGKYAIYFNKQYDYNGHLFQDRFYSTPAKTIAQLLAISSYIHLNPVTANMVTKPEDYPYSNYRFLIGSEKCGFVNSEKILAPFGNEHPYKTYKDFVESMIGTVPASLE
ncbi:MAG TPA: transposase [Epulopiscium sp.]|nr:transposase [Candidatus Epulonipiscium sp.]